MKNVDRYWQEAKHITPRYFKWLSPTKLTVLRLLQAANARKPIYSTLPGSSIHSKLVQDQKAPSSNLIRPLGKTSDFREMQEVKAYCGITSIWMPGANSKDDKFEQL